MRNPKVWLSVLCVAVLLFTIGAGETDGIREKLDAARKAYATVTTEARKNLLTAFDDRINDVAATGNLEEVKSVRADKEAFENDGKLPKPPRMIKAVNAYQIAVKNARETMEAAYDGAVRDYTKALDIENAEAVKTESESFRKGQSPTIRPGGATSTNIRVVTALWGVGDQVVDVRAFVQSQINQGFAVVAGNSTLQVKNDPAFGKVKSLRIDLQSSEGAMSMTIADGGSFSWKPSNSASSQAMNSKDRTDAAALTKRLIGSRWTGKDNAVFTFQADGTLESSTKDNATWTAIDARHVIRKTESNWVDVLVFDEGVSQYTLHPKDFVKTADGKFTGKRLK